MSNIKISELTEATEANENDLLMIIQNGENKKIKASKVGTGKAGGGDTLPIGAILPFSSDTVPNGWLLCDGSSFSTTSYPELFNVIGTTYGYDDDRNPKLPDLRGRVAVGKKDATSADDTEFSILGNTGGEKTHTLTTSEIPSHSHHISSVGIGSGSYGYNISSLSIGSEQKEYTDNTGGGQPHNNLQPYLVTNYIIKAKMTVAIEGEIIQEDGTASETNVYSAKAIDNKLNESGEGYIKYPDGTMICYGEYSFSDQTLSDYYSFCKLTPSINVTFPKQFKETPTITISSKMFQMFSTFVDSVNNSSFKFRGCYPSNYSSLGGVIDYIAIGKWK